MIRVGILGYGYWGQLLAARAMALPIACVTAIADQDIQKRRKAEPLPNIVVATNLDDLLHEDLGALIVATPASTHETIVSTALAEGMHVFCEKPLALSSNASARLVACAEQRGRVLHVDHTFLFMEEFKYINALFQADPIRSYCSHRINISSGRKDVTIIEDLAIHDFALLDALTADEPEEISLRAVGWPSPDLATITMRFTRGCSASVRVGWRQASKSRDITVIGQHTTIEWRGSALTVRQQPTRELYSPTFHGAGGDALSNALLNFFECIETSTLTNVEAKRATRIGSTLERIRASVPVDVDSYCA